MGAIRNKLHDGIDMTNLTYKLISSGYTQYSGNPAIFLRRSAQMEIDDAGRGIIYRYDRRASFEITSKPQEQLFHYQGRILTIKTKAVVFLADSYSRFTPNGEAFSNSSYSGHLGLF